MRLRRRKTHKTQVVVWPTRHRYAIKVAPVVPDLTDPQIEGWRSEVGRWNYSWAVGQSDWETIATFERPTRDEAIDVAEEVRARLEAIPEAEFVSTQPEPQREEE